MPSEAIPKEEKVTRIAIKGRIMQFTKPRNGETGYAEFVFKSDYSREMPRFEALCCGEIPDVVPAVPMKVELACEDGIESIKKIESKKVNARYLDDKAKEKYQNEVTYACIDFQDEEYARKILVGVKGISEKRAMEILESVDGDISRLCGLWNDTAFWKRLKGSKRYLKELKETVGLVMSKDGLVKRYKRYGLGYPQIDALSAIYGVEAEERLCDNPYKTLKKIDIGFQVADYLAKNLGFDYMSIDRVKAMVYEVLDMNEERGNTVINRRDFYMECAKLHAMSAWEDKPVSPYCILAVMSVMKDVYCEKEFYGYIKTLEQETEIAIHMKRLMDAKTELKTENSVFEKMERNYNQEQMEFLKAFDKNSVTLLLGRGGTGKTHTICGAIRMFKKANPDASVKLCAPTARAAGVLKESSGFPSSTIHIMLELKPYGQEMAGKDENSPVEAGLIVVDEMSMVDTELFYYLLRAVKTGTKLILSGDPDQLESVGAGSVLRDLIHSDAVPKVTLKKIMRQSEGSAIVENCGRLLVGNADFITNENFVVRFCKTEKEARAYLLANYNGDKKRTQILSTTKKGLIGTEALNKEFEDREKEGVWLHGCHFCVGDKVIFTRNNYEAGYCNGDVGYVQSASIPMTVKLQGESGEILEIEKENTVDMEHADAITIHKSQGSEYEEVFVLLPEAPVSLLNRNMINTGISRARKKITVISVNQALRVAVGNKYKRERITRLKNLLKNISEVEEDEKEKKRSTTG